MGEAQDSKVGSRPFMVWVLTLIDAICALFFIVTTAPYFLFPPPHAVAPPGPVQAVLLATAIIGLGAAYGTWRGSKYGRNALLMCTIFLIAVIIYNFSRTYIATTEHAEYRKFLGTILQSAALALTVFGAWALLHWWFLARGRGGAFSQARASSNRWVGIRGMMVVPLSLSVLIFGTIIAVYRLSGAPSQPPRQFANLLPTSPNAGLNEQQAFDRFFEIRAPQYDDTLETEKSREITALLNQRFPKGVRESVLIRTLASEGFRRPESPGTECGVAHDPPYREDCHAIPVPEKQIDYSWWRFRGLLRDQCVENILVRWSSDRGVLTEVDGEYRVACGFLFEPRHWPYW
jgi:hypothetical protein